MTSNSNLYTLAKKLGINASQVAEEALIQQVARLQVEQMHVEIRQDLEAASTYIAKHGSFTEMVRQHYRDSDEA